MINDRRLNNRQSVPHKLQQVRRELCVSPSTYEPLKNVHRINFTPGIVPEFHGLALSWSRGTSLSGLLRRIDLAEGDILMLLNQTIDLIQQMQAAVGHVLDKRVIWEQSSPVLTDGVLTKRNAGAHSKNRTEQLSIQRERLELLRLLLAQAASSLLHGSLCRAARCPLWSHRSATRKYLLMQKKIETHKDCFDAKTFAADVNRP